MNLKDYPVVRVDNKLIFIFESTNSFGLNPIFKIITYAVINKSGVKYYNLGFGDYNADTGLSDDTAISNNGDMRRVLSTVASTLKIFFEERPHETVLISGSDPIRNYYYQKLVHDYEPHVQELYCIQGCKNGIYRAFSKGQPL